MIEFMALDFKTYKPLRIKKTWIKMQLLNNKIEYKPVFSSAVGFTQGT